MPMPSRRRIAAHRSGPSASPAAAAASAAAQPSVKKDGRPRPYTVEVPPDAPRLATSTRANLVGADQFGKGYSSGHADFFPWTGKHREDEWSTESISKGVWEKYSSTESSSARPAILPTLKQKTGLSALSSIFTGILSQRRQRGQITAQSTFKPPPRVTLTDTKREVWLKDLANPATSLRRLSRTIPHGIRGRTLLDQCLNKNVPTERAVWLAKCVGANEIRAFKRKGANAPTVMGNEAKWSKDWTMFVEQFVDSVISAPNEPGWKAKVTYAIRLATSLYSEHLLARDHYLDWIISGLENSTQSRLPMWMLIAQIYWSDLLRSRKYGLRTVSALLAHMHTIQHDPDRDILSGLYSQLAVMLNGLVKTNPESFVLPNTWPRYRDSLKAALPADDEASQRAYSSINLRNMRVGSAETSYPPAGRQKLVKLLDSTLPNAMDIDLAAKCWSATDDKTQLIRTLVEWATSMHRSGVARVYVTTAILKSFRAWCPGETFDATTPLLGILDDISPHDQRRKGLVYHLVSELIRYRLFSVPRYLQWLISRGGLHDASDIDPEHSPCSTRLLVELPADSFPASLKADRANLLRRAGDYSTASEEEDIAIAVRCTQHTLGLPLPVDDPMSQRKPMPLKKLLARIRNSSKALKCAVSAQIRTIMTQQDQNGNSGNNSGIGSNSPAFLSIFVLARAILETTEDFVALADVVQSCLKSSDAEVLAACADTVNVNLAVFVALGSAADCFNVLVEQLRALGQQGGGTPHTMLVAVALLAQRIPGYDEVAGQLRQELLQSDRSNALDACSPVSDSMALQAQSGEGELSEEIDKLLASGTRIDHPTMNRLFRAILPRLESGWTKGDDSRRVFASLLTKMRVFDTHHFDKLMSDWVSHVRSMASRPPLAQLFPMLVIMGCLTVPALLHTANASPPMADKPSAADPDATNGGCATYLQELLELLLLQLPKTTGLSREETYRFRIHQDAARSDRAPAFLGLMRNAIAEYSTLRDQRADIRLALDDPSLRDHVLDALRLLVVLDPPAASEALCIRDLPAGATEIVSSVTTQLLLPDGPADAHISFDRILGLATELTLPFCQIKLEFDLSVTEWTNNQGAAGESSPAPSRFDLFSNAVDRAIEANNITWTSMLPCLSGEISQHLRNIAHARFLSLVPSLRLPDRLQDTTSRDQIHLGENLVGVVEAMSAGHQPNPTPTPTRSMTTQPPGELVDKLNDLCEIISANNRQQVDDSVRAAVLDHWLPALLRLITSHVASATAAGTATNSNNTGHELRARIVVALCSLLLELQSLPDSAATDLAERVFDVAMLLVDVIPDDMRLQCARSIIFSSSSSTSSLPPTGSSDPKLCYLLGAPQPTTTADRLVLVHRENSSAGAAKSSSSSVLQAHAAVGQRNMGAMYGIGPAAQERHTPFVLKQWEMLSESTPMIGENDASLSLGLFEAIRIQ